MKIFLILAVSTSMDFRPSSMVSITPGIRLRVSAAPSLRLPSGIRTPTTTENDRAATVALTKSKLNATKPPEEVKLLDQPKGIIESTLNALYSTQKSISTLSSKLDGATTEGQKQAIQKEIAAQTDEYERIKSSDDVTSAVTLLKQFQDKLTKSKSADERNGIRNQILANRDLFGDRVTNLLTSANDDDLGKIIGNLTSLLTSSITTKAAGGVGVFDLFDGQQLSEAGDPIAFAKAQEANIAAGGNGKPTRTVYGLQFGDKEQRSDSQVLLDNLSKSFEKLAEQLKSGKATIIAVPGKEQEASDGSIREPTEAAQRAQILKNSIQDTNLVSLLQANRDINRLDVLDLLF